MILANVTDAPTGVPSWIYIVLTVLGIIGVGGLAAFYRGVKSQAVRDSKLDELIDPKDGVMARFEVQSAQVGRVAAQVADLQRSMRPNGLDTDQLGDIAKRTEKKVIELADSFNRHLGASEEIHRTLREDIARKQDRQR